MAKWKYQKQRLKLTPLPEQEQGAEQEVAGTVEDTPLEEQP